MALIPHFEATPIPADISAGLDEGKYLAQVRGPHDGVGVLYASAVSAPSHDADYFQCWPSAAFVFFVRSTSHPVWVKSAVGSLDPDSNLVVVARAKL